MWTKLLVAAALLSAPCVSAADCADGEFSVSVLDVAGVMCVSSAPCSGTYYASGLSQGVGACPSGMACALMPETPIMGCAESGRTDLTYVNADGTLTKDGKSISLEDATKSSTTTSSSTTTDSSTSSTSSTSASASSSSTEGGSSSSDATASASSSSEGSATSAPVSASDSLSTSASTSNSTTSDSDDGSSGSEDISLGSSSANQQASFNPADIESDNSNASNAAASSGLSIGAYIAIVVACLAVVAVAVGVRMLKKGRDKEAELTTPEQELEGYGAARVSVAGAAPHGGGLTPKDNVLLL